MSISIDDIFGRLTLITHPTTSTSTSKSTTIVAAEDASASFDPVTDDPPPPYTRLEIGLAITTPEPVGLGISHAHHTSSRPLANAHIGRPPRNGIATLTEALRTTRTKLHNIQDELRTCKMQKESLHERLIEALDQRDALVAFLQEQEAELKRAREENERLERERDALVIVLTPRKLVNAGPRPDSEDEHEAWRKARELHYQHQVERNLRALGLV